MELSTFVPRYIQRLILRMGISLLMLSLTRILFFSANSDHFVSVNFTDFLAGIWMDCISIGIWMIPFYGFSLIPNPIRESKVYRLFLKSIFHLTNTLLIAFNLLDVAYFEYTAKRSTSDVFNFLWDGDDLTQLSGKFVTDFWWLFIVLILFVWLSNFLYNRTSRVSENNNRTGYFKQLILFAVFGTLFFIMGRGGLGFRPADMLTAAQYTRPENVSLVLNTPLTIIKTVGKESLTEKQYFSEDSENLYDPVRIPHPDRKIAENLNVMILILESFGNEWLGAKSGGSYTPFLDSLIDESLYFENAFANGKKSVEAVPAIFASIPSLMDNPYISSHYGMNSIDALPHLLKAEGYSTGFYHGATNGSMKFDVFAAHIGFENYFGRKEYNNENHSDHFWGILDEYFMPWTARSITKELKEPFLASLFTISSHHPFFVPEKYHDDLPSGPHPMARSIAYGDMSLRLFFKEAKKQPWYNNTLFILCADHTPAGHQMRYTQRIGMYQIPILIYDPLKRIKTGREKKLFNHIDIAPTVLDLVGYKSKFYAFGKSHFDNAPNFVINYISNTYHYLEEDYMINFVNDKTIALYNYKKDTLMQYDSLKYYPAIAKEMEHRLKGIIQTYNHDLIHNEMKVK
ncbi:MAG: LTA synthase family protein [Brumimicrobium sp.]|nr:LTA synthase family protein [Brumimicrobium sp.]